MSDINTANELEPAGIMDRMNGIPVPHPVEKDRVDAFLPSPVVQNHAANLSFLPDGTLACVWFGGTMEGMGDISVYMSRLEAGRWTAAVKLTDDDGRSEQNPLLFNAPDGRVFLFHTSQPGGRQDECEIRCRISADGGRSFGPSQRVGDFRGVFVRQPVQIAADGAWLLPGFRCITPEQGRWTGGLDTAVVLVSHDQGKNWASIEVPDSVGAVHMNPVPSEGGMMPAFYRDRFASNVRRSVSSDGGLTWASPEPTPLPNNNSSVQAIRLGDGRIAMVLNPVNATMSSDRRASLYDEIEGETESGPKGTGGAIWGVPRAPMSLVFSTDNGQTFSPPRHLETGSGYCLTNNSKDGLNREYSYPSIVEGPDGDLHIAYTYHRRAIKHVRLLSGISR